MLKEKYDGEVNKSNKKPSMRASALASAGAGTFAGAMGIMVGHPFDTLKTRVQVGKGFRINQSSLVTMKELYRGILPPLFTAGIMQSINFTGYETVKKLLFSHMKTMYNVDEISTTKNQRLYLLAVFIAGSISGAFISLLATPISLIKVQQQLVTRMGVFECARHLYSKYGFTRFYRGYCSMFMMESYGRGVYLWTYEASKITLADFFNSIQPNSSSSYTDDSTIVKILSASSAGCCSWLSIYPWDVLKSRMQMDIECKQFKSCQDCFYQTWREGGITLMFRGLKYTLIRAAPVAATILPLYEYTRHFLENQLDRINI
jgi:solute carrier family 25 carnitine/acylcarnitine transporter 20/29